ncbi:MAG: DMT family transporter [Herbaspirillum sp.]|uniref:DMT family transporter n=1 Tax=Herbaspirillum sp. TaxID=1890675 RepID=UPI002587ED6A|nr:DMT family transporter [Herbaspirillum sp.]MCP3656966.1 DMT family transporter [Herbaspirillum sp.]MCP3949019.1 DMT family transporter [Herbaspirillum sp.]MCP4030451.1 DMT family transporter [Herbaspirillum sp.]MCP4557803.1 DMT family transporter [Herbaspirillum sp.]
MTPHWFGVALASAALCMFSANVLVIKQGSERLSLNLGFLLSVGVNLLFCALLLAGQLMLSGSGIGWSWRAVCLFMLGGAFSTYLGRWFFFEAVVRMGSAKASLFQVSSPGFAALIAWVVLGETLSPVRLGAIVFTIFGLALIGYVPGTLARPRHQTQALDAVAARPRASLSARLKASTLMLGTGGSMAYAISTVARGAAIRDWNAPLVGALLGASTGLLLHVVFSPDIRTIAAGVRTADRRGVMLFLASGVLSISAQICSIWSLRYVDVALSNLITLSTPLLVIPCGYYLFEKKEILSSRTWMGGAMVLAGVATLTLSR